MSGASPRGQSVPTHPVQKAPAEPFHVSPFPALAGPQGGPHLSSEHSQVLFGPVGFPTPAQRQLFGGKEMTPFGKRTGPPTLLGALGCHPAVLRSDTGNLRGPHIVFCFFFNLIFIYLAALSLSCGMWDL